MNKETVFLADSSYAIRKISERNFSEEAALTLVSFKSGDGLREQLLQQRPLAILVELKLPAWDGYEICRFINTEPTLQNTHVFLLRAAFDPVEEEKLHGMKFIDIVTKPFDHAVLVENIEKLKPQTKIPTPSKAPSPAIDIPVPTQLNPPGDSAPEDFPEIDDFDSPSEELSFSDIQNEIASGHTPPPMTVPSPPVVSPLDILGDDIVPSEEITQGSIPTRADPLASTAHFDELDNPFDDHSLNEQIKEQEHEMGIGSITQEAMAIEAAIKQNSVNEATDSGLSDSEEPESSTSEIMPDLLDNPKLPDDFNTFHIDKDDPDFQEDSFKSLEENEPKLNSFAEQFSFSSPLKDPDVEEFNSEKDEFDIDEAEQLDSFDRPKSHSFMDVSSPSEEDFDFASSPPENETVGEDVEALNNWAAPQLENDDHFVHNTEKKFTADPISLLAMKEELDSEISDFSQDLHKADRFDDFPGIDDPSNEDSYNAAVPPEPDNTRTTETQAIDVEELPPPPPVIAEKPTVKPASSPSPHADFSFDTLNHTDREIIMQRIEQNISQTLKDILWDVIPPIAERVIREEIESIKKEIAAAID